MAVLDVLDQLGQGGEVEPAAPEAAGIGEEGGGGDPCHHGVVIEVRVGL